MLKKPGRAAVGVFYLRLGLIMLWLFVSCAAGLALCLARRGDLSLDRDFARIFAWGALRLAGIRVELTGAEHLEKSQPCIIVANHQSGLDMATYGSMYPGRTLIIGKRELRWIPLFGWFFSAAGNLLIDRQNRMKAMTSLSPAIAAIRERQASVWVFPEGTRNAGRGHDLLPFKKGAFYMAVAAGVPVVPVLCSPLHPVMSWKERRMNGGRVRIQVLPAISTEGLGLKDTERLSREVREKMQEALRGLALASSSMTPVS